MTFSPLLLAVSMGDPAGIGPEIIAAAWHARSRLSAPFVVFGDAALISRYAPVARCTDAPTARTAFDKTLPVVDIALSAPCTPGKPDAAHAGAIIGALDTALDWTFTGVADALVTAPISKAVLYAAGFDAPGHTEYIARRTAHIEQEGPRGPVMMLVGGGLRVALVTIHEPLARVASLIRPERVEQTIRVVDHALRTRFGISRPRLVVCGLNPHAGEDGALGTEERDIINPVTGRLRAEGLHVSDALPADTLFHAEARATYDAAIAMSHDQGLIPVKTLDFHGGVNVTLGLPVIRTSPDHGTAFDIAGQGVARPDSMIAALNTAAALARMKAGLHG